jgi:hypothetical protein
LLREYGRKSNAEDTGAVAHPNLWPVTRTGVRQLSPKSRVNGKDRAPCSSGAHAQAASF